LKMPKLEALSIYALKRLMLLYGDPHDMKVQQILLYLLLCPRFEVASLQSDKRQ